MEELRRRARLFGAVNLRHSTRKGKKYMLEYDGKTIHFGARGMSDYTMHKDKKRRENYLRRSKAIRDKHGRLTYNNKRSANYWARTLLW
jgi:hypothetical protein